MIEYRWEQSLSPGNEQSFYWGSAAADQPGSRNLIGIKNPAIDSLIERVIFLDGFPNMQVLDPLRIGQNGVAAGIWNLCRAHEHARAQTLRGLHVRIQVGREDVRQPVRSRGARRIGQGAQAAERT